MSIRNKTGPHMQPFQGLMIDIETMGLEHDAFVLTVGLALFTPKEIMSSTQFAVDLEHQKSLGRKVDITTALWWMDDDQAHARRRLLDPSRRVLTVSHLHAVLDEWCHRDLPDWHDQMPVWACGADFDFPILASLLRANHMELPWKFWQQHDFRTIKHTCPRLDFAKPAAHDAEADARWQADYLIQLNQELGLVVS